MSSTCPTISESIHSSNRPAPQATLASLFTEVCARRGEAVAVSMGNERLTFAQLEAAAERVASGLTASSLPSGALVAIYLPRSIDMVIAMLGVVKAGGAYLPIDSGYPSARVKDTLQDAAPVAVITDSALTARLEGESLSVLTIDALKTSSRTRSGVRVAAPDDLAYVIFTSGSTGRPKGVMVTQQNVIRLLSATEPWFHFDESDVWTMFHSFAFDFSVWEMWGPLLTGGRLVLVPFAVSRSPEDFYALLSQEGVTVLNQTPSAFALLVQAVVASAVKPLKLRYVIFGGEALNLRSLAPWVERFGDATPQLINMYGITETTVHVTCRRILSGDIKTETDSLIGVPIPDLQLHLLNDSLLPVNDGEVGEMCIGGAGVAMGYLGRPELTTERFIADPFGDSHARLYRSGDLARRRADGELVYLGRADRQVKINGFRIELGEIEAALLSAPAIQHGCVIAHTDEQGTQSLIAYYVTQEATDAKALGVFLSERLPSHMRPAIYIKVASIPLTGNGKVDREALPAPMAAAPPIAAKPSIGAPMELRISAIWSSVLQNGSIGLDENFFDIGGTSVRLIAVRSALQQELNITIPVTWLFEHTTIRSLAARLSETAKTGAPAEISAVQKRAAQQRDAFARMRALKGVK